MITFYGFRKPNEAIVFSNENDTIRRLPLFLDEVNHSPTGFEWGYGGSGPAQLAYAILRKFADKDFAQVYYQQFKWDIVAKFDKDNWTLTGEQIEYWYIKTLDSE
jgi:hypothetical protein